MNEQKRQAYLDEANRIQQHAYKSLNGRTTDFEYYVLWFLKMIIKILLEA